MADLTYWKTFLNQKVHVVLDKDIHYNGIVTAVDDAGNGLVFIHILDKFNQPVLFSIGEIKKMELWEEKR